jgi:hypothetical protein
MKQKTTIDPAVLSVKVNLVATIRDAKTGRVKRVQKVHNIVPTVGRAAIASWLGNVSASPATLYPNYCALGTGTNVPANGDTTLQTETYRNLVASRTNASNVAYITGFFSATEYPGAGSVTLKEAALFIAGTASANTGTLFSRVAINISKSTSETLTLDWTITIS